VKLEDALANVTALFLDTGPVIYLVERHPRYVAVLVPIFEQVRAGALVAVTSPITLAECLVAPYRLGATKLQEDFFDLVVHGRGTRFVGIDEHDASEAARLRARYNLGLADALQVACALRAGCNAILTNDDGMRRVTELRVIVVDDLEV
jgi:predicted nucleic acid-binding protein